MTIAFSVIVPAHNEAECLPDLLAELQVVLNSVGGESEILVIDDGSTDATVSILKHWSIREPRFRWIRLNGNFGQSAAFDAGFRLARGKVFITLDADGQNPPSEIPKLLAALSGCDMVCGWRLGRKDHWTKYLASKFANTLRRCVLRDGIHDSGCSLKAFRREAVSRIKLFHGLHRFLPALVQMEGYTVREVRVTHRPRHGGRSHYGIMNRMLGPLLDMFAVLWMKRRTRQWGIAELPRDTATNCDTYAAVKSTTGTATDLGMNRIGDAAADDTSAVPVTVAESDAGSDTNIATETAARQETCQ